MSRPDSTSYSSEPPPNDSPEAPGDEIPIVPRWRRLASTDPESPDFRRLLSSLTAEAGRSSTTKLRGDDAMDVLNIIDKVGLVCDNTRRAPFMLRFPLRF